MKLRKNSAARQKSYESEISVGRVFVFYLFHRDLDLLRSDETFGIAIISVLGCLISLNSIMIDKLLCFVQPLSFGYPQYSLRNSYRKFVYLYAVKLRNVDF